MSSAFSPPPVGRPPLGRTAARRHAWALPALVVVLIGMPILEVWVLIQVGQAIGVAWTIVILIAGALLGGVLVRREGSRAWRALNAAVTTGQMPTGQLADAALVLVGGALLLLPGFVTDVVGFLCLLPFTRPLIRRLLAAAIARRIARSDFAVMRARVDRSNLIEGETVAQSPTAEPPGDPRNVVIRGEVEGNDR